MERTTIDGVELSYRIAGEPAAKPILFIHGYTGNARNWALTVKPVIAAGWRTLSADNPGHGLSSAPADPACYTILNMAELQYALAKQCGFEPAVVVGHSMGGAIAEEYALRHPDSVSGLVLVDSAGGSARGRIAPAEQLEKLEEIARSQGTGAVWDAQVSAGWRDVSQLSDSQREVIRQEFSQTSVDGYIHCGRALGDREETLSRLKNWVKPTLVIRGENEGQPLARTADELAAAIPGARYEIIPSSGHNPQLENPSRFNEVLLSFLADV
jgi:pimeloyl-ACP methyl ester carboxylesterase